MVLGNFRMSGHLRDTPFRWVNVEATRRRAVGRTDGRTRNACISPGTKENPARP